MCKQRKFEEIGEKSFADFEMDGENPFDFIDPENSSGIHYVKRLWLLLDLINWNQLYFFDFHSKTLEKWRGNYLDIRFQVLLRDIRQ